jgi:Family of unknown function (DUF5675)
MILNVNSFQLTDESTISKLSIDGKQFCFCLEDAVRPVKIQGVTAIPEGTYGVVLYTSPKHGLVPLLVGVPDFEYVEIHPGNSSVDTKGCILPGLTFARDWVSSSVVAFTGLLAKVKGAIDNGDTVSITVARS